MGRSKRLLLLKDYGLFYIIFMPYAEQGFKNNNDLNYHNYKYNISTIEQSVVHKYM
jgi:hypothetical protein